MVIQGNLLASLIGIAEGAGGRVRDVLQWSQKAALGGGWWPHTGHALGIVMLANERNQTSHCAGI